MPGGPVPSGVPSCPGSPPPGGSHPAQGPLLPGVPSYWGSLSHLFILSRPGDVSPAWGQPLGTGSELAFPFGEVFLGWGVPALPSPFRSQHQHKGSVLPLSPPAQPPLITRGNKILINGWPLPGRGGLCAPPGAGGHSLSLLVSSASPLKGDQPPFNLGLYLTALGTGRAASQGCF